MIEIDMLFLFKSNFSLFSAKIEVGLNKSINFNFFIKILYYFLMKSTFFIFTFDIIKFIALQFLIYNKFSMMCKNNIFKINN